MSRAAAPLSRRYCANHPERPALGVCVITDTPICGECSTRYEGVNYSREGLRILKERRAAAAGAKRGKSAILSAAGLLLTPLLVWGVYLAYAGTAAAMISFLHRYH